MTDDRREIALRALRAAGHDQAAELVQAIIPAGTPDPAAAPAGEPTPGQAYAAQQAQQAVAQAGEQVPAGLMTREQLAEYEANPTRPRSYAERAALAEQVAASFDYHEGRR